MKNKQKGFTLIEILVITSMIAIISVMLVVNWRKNEDQYKIQRAAQEIAQNIRKAQEMALNSFKYEDEVPYNYGVYFRRTIPNSYKVYADINGNNRYNGASDLTVKDVSLEGVEIYYFSTGTIRLDFLFSIPDGFTIFYPIVDSASVIIRKPNGSCPDDCKTITVNSTGQINIE